MRRTAVGEKSLKREFMWPHAQYVEFKEDRWSVAGHPHSDRYYSNPGWQNFFPELKVTLERTSKIWEEGLKEGLTKEVIKWGGECLIKHIDDLNIDFLFIFST